MAPTLVLSPRLATRSLRNTVQRHDARLWIMPDEHLVTTNFVVPNSFEQIAAAQPNALIMDVAVGQSAGWELLE